jgi:NAD-dependent SIR2 family protein deacetylase
MFGHQIPCAKVVIDFDGEVNTIRCHVCTHMKGKEKLSIPKFNSLQNDVNRCKCKVARPNCNMFNNIRNMSTWNHNTQTMNFSTFKERDTVTEQQVTPIM